MLDEDDVTAMLINPFYAVTIDPDLAVPHESIITKDRWVRANERLIDEIGSEQWLRRLLAVLEGGYPRSPDDPEPADDYTRDI